MGTSISNRAHLHEASVIPLQRFSALKSRDPDEAFSNIRLRQPGVHHFEPVAQPGRRWGIDINFFKLGQVGITSTRSSGYGLSSDPDGYARVFIPAGTAFRIDAARNSREYRTGDIGITPVEPSRAFFRAGFATLLATIPIATLEGVTRQLGVVMPTRTLLTSLRETSGRALEPFALHLSFLIRLVDEEWSMILSQERFTALHEDLLLLHLAHALVSQELAPSPGIGSRCLRRSVEMISDQLSVPIDLGDLAAHAGCSLRALQNAFKREFQTTITDYIRQSRLKMARRILESPADGDSVSTIAMDCGFAHLSDFARHYAAAFGERPSETLRRARATRFRRH